MSYNSFEYYQQLRQHQLHRMRLQNPESSVPTHVAFLPKSRIEEDRSLQRQKRILQIQKANEQFMNKLVNINRRKSTRTCSLPSISLRRPLKIPQHEKDNDRIAQKLIESKSTLTMSQQLKAYHMLQDRKRSLSKFQSERGSIVDRSMLVARWLLNRKMNTMEITKSRVSTK